MAAMNFGRNNFSDSGGEAADLEIVPNTAFEAQERAQTHIMIETAKKYPRVLEKVKEKMETYALLDEETAASCFYTLKRKDRDSNEETVIQGPSVRMAEIALVCYQNLRAGARIISNDGERLTSQGMCIDLENNVGVDMTVERRISSKPDKQGRVKTFSMDMQIVTANAANAIAFRNAVFKTVPMALVKPIVEKCKKAAAGEGPIERRWQLACKWFIPYGITSAMLLAWLEKDPQRPVAEQIGDDDVTHIRGLFTSLKDGETTMQDEFRGINKDGSKREEGSVDRAAEALSQRIKEENEKGPELQDKIDRSAKSNAPVVNEQQSDQVAGSLFGNGQQQQSAGAESQPKQQSGPRGTKKGWGQ